MNQDALLRVAVGFIVLWAAIGLMSWLHIRSQTSAEEKKKWFDRYAWLLGAFVAGTGGAILVSQGNLIGSALTILILGTMVWLRIRGSFFCGACGKFSATRNWFAKEFRCPHCDNRLK